MIQMSFLYEQVKIGQVTGMRLLGYEGEARRLRVPDSLDGLPVISVGKQAFTEKNHKLEEVTLPAGLLEVESFAFSFCSALRKLNLSDSIVSFHDGAIRTCFNLRDIELKISNNGFVLARRLLGDSDRKLRVKFLFSEEDLQLVFPDYYSNSIEDTRSHAFHIRIDGCGFSYRECVCTGGLRLREYDSLFGRAVSAGDPEAAASIAVSRLMYPRGLSEQAGCVYRDHIRKHMEQILPLCILQENEGWMELLMKEKLLSEADMDTALRLTTEYGLTQLSGELMAYRSNEYGTKKGILTLEDDW